MSRLSDLREEHDDEIGEAGFQAGFLSGFMAGRDAEVRRYLLDGDVLESSDAIEHLNRLNRRLR